MTKVTLTRLYHANMNSNIEVTRNSKGSEISLFEIYDFLLNSWKIIAVFAIFLGWFVALRLRF